VPPIEHATFGAGCFWGVGEILRELPGIAVTRVGYMGGTKDYPTYEDVCTDTTGHIEVVEVGYDSARITYDDLLDVFWQLHDPTSLDNQGPYELAANIVGSSLSTTPTKKPRQVRQRRRWNAERPTMGRSSPRYGPPRGFGPRRTLTNATSKRAARIIATSSIERLRFLPRARLNTRCKTGRLTASTPDLDI
jgi:methionine-S-sulfoxide reductase